MKVIIYRDEFGFSQFEEWLRNLDVRTRTRIFNRIDRVEAGNLGDFKYLEQGIYELRFFFGSGFRIYFAKEKDQVVVLLTGGDKATQAKDIKKAVKFYKEFLRNKNEI